jgi:UDP-N-acetyl-2-amino-2-deoxyglucuronate dehydrogenase
MAKEKNQSPAEPGSRGQREKSDDLDGKADKLPVAVIGAGGFGAFTLQALLKSQVARVVGVSDRDRAAAEKAGKAAGVPAFSDNRSLLAQTRPAAVYVAVPPAEAPGVVSLCAQRGVHVWKEMPLARTLEEGLGLIQRMERAKLKLAVGTQRRFASGYRRARELYGKLGEMFLAQAHYLFNWGPDLSWRGDRASAGGGALLELGYHPIDLLQWMLGLPEEVYGTSARVSVHQRPSPHGKLQPAYDTDDTAAAILRYASGSVATVVTTRRSGPLSEELSLHGRGGWLMASAETCLLRGPEGEILDSLNAPAPPLEVFRLQADAFAQAVISGGGKYECSARENLLNLATIEAIYLSARTSQPEHPARLLHNHGLTPEQCLLHRPEA